MHWRLLPTTLGSFLFLFLFVIEIEIEIEIERRSNTNDGLARVAAGQHVDERLRHVLEAVRVRLAHLDFALRNSVIPNKQKRTR